MASKVVYMNAWMIIPMLMLLACQQDAQVEVNQLAHGKIEIGVTSDGDKPPCVYSVAISHTVDGKIYSDWSIDLEDKDISRCRSDFTYPDVPQYYHLSQAPIQLKTGVKYDISVVGVGFGGGKQIVLKGN